MQTSSLAALKDNSNKEILQQARREKSDKTRSRFGCTFMLIISLIAATGVKFLLNQFTEGITNIILTCLVFLAAIVLPVLISLYRAGIGLSSIISAVVLGRLDLIGINLSRESEGDLLNSAQSIRRVDAQISEISIRVEGSVGNSHTIVDAVFDCQDSVIRKFSIDRLDKRVAGKHYKRLEDDTYTFIWQGEPLVTGDTGVLSYHPEHEEKGFRGFYKDMTVDDIGRISKLNINERED